MEEEWRGRKGNPGEGSNSPVGHIWVLPGTPQARGLQSAPALDKGLEESS